MEIKTFDISYLNEAKSLLKEVFFMKTAMSISMNGNLLKTY